MIGCLMSFRGITFCEDLSMDKPVMHTEINESTINDLNIAYVCNPLQLKLNINQNSEGFKLKNGMFSKLYKNEKQRLIREYFIFNDHIQYDEEYYLKRLTIKSGKHQKKAKEKLTINSYLKNGNANKCKTKEIIEIIELSSDSEDNDMEFVNNSQQENDHELISSMEEEKQDIIFQNSKQMEVAAPEGLRWGYSGWRRIIPERKFPANVAQNILMPNDE